MRNTVFLMLLIATTPLKAQLCAADTGSKDNLRMREEAFTREGAERALAYFKTTLPQLMVEFKEFTRLQGVDRYYISYPNTLRILEGWMLKQDALGARDTLALVEARRRSGGASQEDVTRARAQYDSRRQRFCAFVAAAHYVD
jgi:hypothetical protein